VRPEDLFFSVIMPTHNRPADLANALASLRRQSHTNFEAIVINDGQEPVGSVVDMCGLERVTLLTTTGSLGPGAARNAGFAAARGDIISYLDDDDLYRPEHLAVHAEKYAADGDLHVVYTDAERGVPYGTGLETEVVHSRDFDADAFMVSNYIPILCLSHRRSCLDRTGGFEESLYYLEDWDLFLRLSEHWNFLHVERVTALYVEKGNGNLQQEHSGNIVKNLDAVYQRVEPILAIDPVRRERVWQMRLKYLGKMAYDTGVHLEKTGDLESAAGIFERAAEYVPEPEYYLSLARVRKALGQPDKALVAMQLAQRCLELKRAK